MKRQKFTLAIIASLLVMFIASLASAGIADYIFAKGTGLDYMNNGQYQKAITELEKVAYKQDLELQLALIECYLKVNNDSKADQIAEAVDKNIEYQSEDAGNKLAKLYLRSLADCKQNIGCCYNRLLLADKYAKNKDLCKQIGEMEKMYAAHFRGQQKNHLLQRAVHHLGHGPVFGYEVKRLDANSIKITFFTNQSTNVLQWKKGVTITFTEALDKENTFIIDNLNPNKSYPIPLNFPLKARSTNSLILKGQKGKTVTLQMSELNI